MKKKNDSTKQTISIPRAIAYATSTSFTIITLILIGYFVGKKWGTTGMGIGILIGGLLGIFLMLNELYVIFKKKK